MRNIFDELPRISAVLLTEPWLIIPERHAALVMNLEAALLRREIAVGFAPAPAAAAPRKKPAKVFGEVNDITVFDESSRIGVINVDGVIGKGLSRMDMDCGGVCLDQVEGGLKALRELDPVAVAMHFNTPGGTVGGVEECAAAMEEFSANVAPIHGYTGSLCASAGAWLSASCVTMHAGPSATLGSIGVYHPLFDYSKQYEKQGIKVEMVSTGPLKGAGFRGTPGSEAQLAAVRENVDRIGGEFFAHMRARRKDIDPATHFTGGTWVAKTPAAAALHDGLIRGRQEHFEWVLDRHRPGRA